MSKLPPIPPEQRHFDGESPRDRLRSAEPARRDFILGLEPDADGEPDEKAGRAGNRRQNLGPQRNLQAR